MQRQRPDLEHRLQSVLRDYQLLANSDQLQLRALIPPTEIWRLFVESDRQRVTDNAGILTLSPIYD